MNEDVDDFLLRISARPGDSRYNFTIHRISKGIFLMAFRHFKPLSHLFRPPPPVPAVPEDEVSATAAALGDGAEALRAAAIRKLEDGEALRSLAGLIGADSPSVPAALQRTAQERLAELIDAGAVDFAQLFAATANRSAVLSVAVHCGNPDHLPQALASINDPGQLAALVLEGSSSRLRQLAADRLENPAELARLLKQVRGRDKNTYKIIKQKCDALRAEEQRIAQIDRDVDALCASLERHSHRIYDALYPTSLKLFEEEWRTLEPKAAPEARERARQAIEQCHEVIAGRLRRLSEQAAQESHQAALKAARQEDLALAEREAQRRHEAAALASAEAAKAHEAEDKARSERLAAEALFLRQLGGLIGKTHAALREGNTRRAAALRRAIEEKVPAAPAIPTYLLAQLQQLDVKLNELKEWKDYAVAPKRAELIEEMESLIGSSEPPQALAGRIKQLQEDWKTISKGIISDAGTDWQRFHEASEAAYQPCREYFEAQAKMRLTNVERRNSVLERLRAFESAQSGEHTDWRAVAAVLREAPQELRRYSPVDRTAARAVQQEFDTSIGRLQERLDGWYAHNVAEKQSLIQRAQQLHAKEDSREAVDAVKRLQLLWKETGAVARHQEQPLWNEFREQCDAVYQKRQQAFVDYSAALENNKRQAVALCEEAEHVAASSGPALLEGMSKITQWRAAFEALGEMPRADQRALHDRFERAVNRCQAKLAQQKALDAEQAFAGLLEAARRIQNYGYAVAQDVALEDRDALKREAEDFIAGVRQWPKGGPQALKDAWAGAHAAAGLDTTAHEKSLRLLCVRSEILTDKPTPPEDQALRREYQVQRLVQHMGQRNEANSDNLDALALEWIRVGPVSAATREELLARFLGCRGLRD
jgi:hypothetical protein